MTTVNSIHTTLVCQSTHFGIFHINMSSKFFSIFSRSLEIAQAIQCLIFPLFSAGRSAMLENTMVGGSSGSLTALIWLIIAQLMQLSTVVIAVLIAVIYLSYFNFTSLSLLVLPCESLSWSSLLSKIETSPFSTTKLVSPTVVTSLPVTSTSGRSRCYSRIKRICLKTTNDYIV